MLWRVKLIASFIVAISLWGKLTCQTLAETFAFAEAQHRIGEVHVAEKAYKRVLFFDTANQYRGRCMEILAGYALEQGNHVDALNYLDQAYFLAASADQRQEFQFQRIRIFIENGAWPRALAEIYQMDPEADPGRVALYEGYCQYLLKDYGAAAMAFRQVGLYSDIQANRLDHFIEKASRIEKMNPKFYQVLSYIIPGSGQILLGDVKNSLNSMILNGGLAVLFVHTAQRISFFDAVLSVMPWFYRYYSGGAKLTRELAIERKAARHRNNLADIMELASETKP